MTIPSDKKRRGKTSYKSQTFLGKIVQKEEKKDIAMNSPALYRHFINEECKVGDEIAITLTNRRPKRTDLQNNYYWLFLSLIATSSGHTTEELHIWAKGKFLTQGMSEVYGSKVRIVRSTTKLNVGEFCEYIMRIEEATGIPSPKTDAFIKPLTYTEYDALKEEQKQAYSAMKAKIVL